MLDLRLNFTHLFDWSLPLILCGQNIPNFDVFFHLSPFCCHHFELQRFFGMLKESFQALMIGAQFDPVISENESSAKHGKKTGIRQQQPGALNAPFYRTDSPSLGPFNVFILLNGWICLYVR